MELLLCCNVKTTDVLEEQATAITILTVGNIDVKQAVRVAVLTETLAHV